MCIKKYTCSWLGVLRKAQVLRGIFDQIHIGVLIRYPALPSQWKAHDAYRILLISKFAI
jgi:hypothetical protein